MNQAWGADGLFSSSHNSQSCQMKGFDIPEAS